MEKKIRIVAGVVADRAGRVLLVRKAGTSAFMQPGGKAEPNEGPMETLRREVQEELGCSVDNDMFEYVGRFVADAANEPGWIVEAELYKIRLLGAPAPQAEIAEMIWLDPSISHNVPLAPLTEKHVLRLVQSRMN